MILTVDVGNTNIVLGVYKEEKLAFVSRLSTNVHKTDSEYATKIRSILSLNDVDSHSLRGAIISSVVPNLNHVLLRAIKMVYGVDALLVGPGVKTGINLQVDNPSQVGSDLICGCVGAHQKYEGKVLIIDMGTATKFTIVDENGIFRGVSIAPGVELSLKALTGGTAQLPGISLEAPSKVIAKNTVECMRSGIVFGSASMIDGMIDRIEEEFGEKLTLIATGGLSETIIPNCRHEILIDNDLILDGLYSIYMKNK